jgi:hypothetical protein
MLQMWLFGIILTCNKELKNIIITYSAGNFIFGGNVRKHYHPALAKITIQDNNIKREIISVKVKNYCV